MASENEQLYWPVIIHLPLLPMYRRTPFDAHQDHKVIQTLALIFVPKSQTDETVCL
ncbi:hypothetical protein PILCRDRAFT_821465 [Piloderma croceum F 1598]|uniref:Uncharacterized protein n=1 Tax=Piloderma croceum (strain F 1598) TaxID=765440 RepID=A0A0C3FNQ0_PILCF|nr:hypothetical protein PILCRDRAFT_821465 [Piloderma croceum F 1598]